MIENEILLELIESNNVSEVLKYLHENPGKYDLAEKYYLIAIGKDHIGAMNNLEILCNNKLKLYNCLIKLQQKSDIINNKINELKKIRKIHCFDNKRKLLSKTDTCPICLENTLVIPKECAHFYCSDCYVEINECSICKY